MSTAGNFFETQRKAHDLRTKKLTTASGAITYTARVGGASDNFVIDRVIQVTSTSGNSMTITVPNGKFAGQELLVVLVLDDGGGDEVIINVTTGNNGTTLTATGGFSVMMWIDDTNGWIELAASAT